MELLIGHRNSKSGDGFRAGIEMNFDPSVTRGVDMHNQAVVFVMTHGRYAKQSRQILERRACGQSVKLSSQTAAATKRLPPSYREATPDGGDTRCEGDDSCSQ